MPVLTPAAELSPFPGTRFTPLAAPSRGSTTSSVWTVAIDPGPLGQTHQLTVEEVFVVLEGTATVVLGEESATAAAGDAVVVPPDTDFALGSADDVPVRLLCVLPVGGRARTSDGAVFVPPWAQ